ncbi:MAG: hypothetical protein IT379_41780 [Deltaproteobacteria bacterium]|nr:hypothetical protein [Deltaproteobacteria bacterium]
MPLVFATCRARRALQLLVALAASIRCATRLLILGAVAALALWRGTTPRDDGVTVMRAIDRTSPRPTTASTASPEALAACEADDPDVFRSHALGPAPSRHFEGFGPVFGGYGFFAVDGPAPEPRAADVHTEPLDLGLSGPPTRAVGELLDLTLSFEARTETWPVVVVRALDGSLEHWRRPTYDLYVRREGDPYTYRWAFVGRRCGNTDDATPWHYVSVEPGERRTEALAVWQSRLEDAVFTAPGRYTAWVVYRFCGDVGVRHPPRGHDYVHADAHVGRYVSNAITIDVR